MASFTSSGWASGATVSAYARDAFDNQTGSALGNSPQTANAAGQVTFSGLADSTKYVASDGSRSVRFRTSDTVATAQVSAYAAQQGLLTQNYDLGDTAGGVVLVSGDVQMIRVPWTKTQLVTSIAVYVSTAGATLTAGQNLAGVYAADGTLLATSVDQSSAWTSAGYKLCALTAPTTIPATAEGYVYVALMSNGTTPAAFLKWSASSAIGNSGLPAAAKRWPRGATARTTLPSPITMSSNVDGASSFWAGLA